jgi:hypothetical protein
MLFDGVDRGQIAALGETRRPSIADVFVAVMSSPQNPTVAAGGNK